MMCASPTTGGTMTGLSATLVVFLGCNNFLLTLAAFNGSSQQTDLNSSVTASDLVKYLFDGSSYDPRVPHRTTKTMETLYVETKLSPWAIIGLNAKDQLLKSAVWMTFIWTDARLSWNPEDFNGIGSLQLPSNMFWKPDFFLQNGANDDFYMATLDKEGLCYLTHAGLIEWYPIIMTETSCDIHVATYPLDTQECFYQVGTWMYNNNMVSLRCTNCTSLDMRNMMKNNEWEVVDSWLGNTSLSFTNNYTSLRFYLRLQRRLSFYTFALIVPCVLLTLLTLMIFFIPPQSGEKLSLGVATWTSLVVFLLILVDFIPGSSTQMPIIGLYNTVTLVLVTLSLVFCILTTRTHFGQENTPPSRWVYMVTFKVIAKLICSSIKPDIELYGHNPSEVSNDFYLVEQPQPFTLTNPEHAKGHDSPDGTHRLSAARRHRTHTDTHCTCPRSHNGQSEQCLPGNRLTGWPSERSSRNLQNHVDYSKLWQTMARVYDRFFFFIHVMVTTACCAAVACIYFT